MKIFKPPSISKKVNNTSQTKYSSRYPHKTQPSQKYITDALYISSAVLGMIVTYDAYFGSGLTKDQAYKKRMDHELEIIQDLNKTDQKILELIKSLDIKIENNSKAIKSLQLELSNQHEVTTS